jgi:hypothetical protein
MGESNSVGDKFRQPRPAPELVGLIRGRGRGVYANSIGSGCLKGADPKPFVLHQLVELLTVARGHAAILSRVRCLHILNSRDRPSSPSALLPNK